MLIRTPHEPPGAAGGAAQRQRRSRARRRAGRVVLKIEVAEFDLVEALQAAGRLSDGEGLKQRFAWSGRSGGVVAEFIGHWRR